MVESLYSPESSEYSTVVDEAPLQKLNSFLESRDISPVRYPLKTPWEDASARTKRRHLRKAGQAVSAVLDEVAPDQSSLLWDSLKTTNIFHSDSEEDGDGKEVDNVMMALIVECYSNADSWPTRRQMLSVVADKVPFKTLQKWIPSLTRYRYTSARKHALLHGRGVLPPQQPRSRMAISQAQLDQFLDFITSPHIIQYVL